MVNEIDFQDSNLTYMRVNSGQTGRVALIQSMRSTTNSMSSSIRSASSTGGFSSSSSGSGGGFSGGSSVGMEAAEEVAPSEKLHERSS